MNAQHIEEKFSTIQENSTYLRVSETHPLELYLGLNELGQKTLRFNGDFVPVKIVGNSVLVIKQVKTSLGHSILFSYNAKDNYALFYKLCEDIINHTSHCEVSNGYVEIVNRYNQWRKLFYGSKNILAEPEVQGLIGELLFLKDYAMKIYGVPEGLNSWSGPEPTHKDFSHDSEWYEIKSINSKKQNVTISSLEQLDSNVPGKLVVYHFEKMSPNFNGISLNQLVDLILKGMKYNNDIDLFQDKLINVGYCYNEVYDNYVYNLVKKDVYTVNEFFPRINMEDLPRGVVKVKYDIELSAIEKFKES